MKLSLDKLLDRFANGVSIGMEIVLIVAAALFLLIIGFPFWVIGKLKRLFFGKEYTDAK